MMSRLGGYPVHSAVTALICVGVAGAMLTFVASAAPEIDLSSLTTLKTTRTDSGGIVLTTSYHPLAVALPAILAVIGLVSAGFAILRPATAGGEGSSAVNPSVPAEKVATVGHKLEKELGKVLGLIRAHLGSSESYAKSLANAQSRLAALEEPKQVRVIISLLVAENERMRLDTKELKGKLEAAEEHIENLRSSLSEAQEQGMQDPLTSVGNRRCFDEVLKKEIVSAETSRKPLSLVMCDVDNFKFVNDTYGHAVGDEVLKMFARLLADNVRDGDTVARFGGEEFGIILPQTTQASATNLAERMRRQCEIRQLTVRNSNKKIGTITASFGVAQLREGEGSDMLVQRADAKLYEAKCTGRNKVAVYGHASD